MESARRGNSWRFAAAMLGVLLVQLWLRGHAFWPTLRPSVGFDPYLVTSAEAEPLDCDEAIYGYIGGRLAHGAVMYHDLTENKPPGGYWIFAAAVALGGPHELTIHLLPLPFVLLTTLFVGLAARTMAGGCAGLMAALLFAVVSTDPYVYGESANMEHLVNAFAMAALALIVAGPGRPGRGRLLLAGGCLAAATLVKQTSIVGGLVLATTPWLRWGTEQDHHGRWARRIDLTCLAAGFLGVAGLAFLVLWFQGAAPQAFQDIIRYGGALAAETPPPPNAPSRLVRWLTGNAAPDGRLPWPFGTTNYLVWWGTGTWPIWASAVPALPILSFGRCADARRRLVAAWTLAAAVQVVLPGLYWPHYYLLPLPGLALAIGVVLADQVSALIRGPGRRAWPALVAGVLLSAIGWTAVLQTREYLLVRPTDLVNVRGGPQWLANRALGREIDRRTRGWSPPATLFVWGWQGPLYFYSQLDNVTPQVFVDDFLRNFAGTRHPIVAPRLERTMRDLRANPPTLMFVAYPPFPELNALLQERYVPSTLSRGLWVERGAAARFETPSAR